MADSPVVRDQESDSRLQRKTARNLPRAALEHVDDRSLEAATLVAAADAGGGAVAVHQHAHFAIRQEQVVATGIGHKETESIAMAADGADDQLQAVDQAVFIGAIQQQLAVTNHRPESFGERLPQTALLDAEFARRVHRM